MVIRSKHIVASLRAKTTNMLFKMLRDVPTNHFSAVVLGLMMRSDVVRFQKRELIIIIITSSAKMFILDKKNTIFSWLECVMFQERAPNPSEEQPGPIFTNIDIL
ncbi:conserved hypothetical protein [Ricinus communis]|uniref:Uncharacterized protein n=1 Tax=Ricinus communis TaxID=3988 RepID=B9RUN5_RICCO|nr:conserved hypothetical protein [Ricinus communis]